MPTTATRVPAPLRRGVVLALALLLTLVALPAGTPAPGGSVRGAAASSLAAACPLRSVPATDFRDATGVHGDAARCLAWYGITNGRSSDRFGINDRITRGQLASLVLAMVEAAGASLPPAGDAFDDAAGSVHEEALERLAAAGILQGTGARRAEPNANLRRGQAATILVGAVEHVEGAQLPAGPDAFDDDDGSVHEPALDAAAAAGLLEGVAPRRVAPGSSMTRGQMASVVARALDRFVEAGRLERPSAPAPRWEAAPLPAAVREEMRGVSWHPGCPVPLADLRLVVLTHRGFDGRLHRGELVVHRTVVDDLGEVFPRLQEADVPLERAERIERFGGDDDRSMDANNTSAFNCRRMTSGSSWSEHAYGTAVDLNPVQNPYVRGQTVLPSAGRDHLDRSEPAPGTFVEGDEVVTAFDAIGWGWGGRWSSAKDYMHFSASGR
jgi:hypothetical protein